eukprot:GHVO01056282.1.p1 GENE.GHVO01056282.1~~GHVO01056282.1.p1  ORF type:complete len:231 (+),score=39.29 GHVO01056282.1:277-969(+)
MARLRPTHFICFPLAADPRFRESFEMFKNAILSDEKYGINTDAMFMRGHRLHLTLTVVRLLDDKAMKKAASIMESLRPDIYDALGTRSLLVDLRGVDIMNDDPQRTRVMYTSPKGSGYDLKKRLDSVTEIVLAALRGSDLITTDEMVKGKVIGTEGDIDVLLHVTLMNAKYSKRGVGVPPIHHFDSRNILNDFKDYNFGTVKLSEIHLSFMTEFDEETNFYKALTKIQLP